MTPHEQNSPQERDSRTTEFAKVHPDQLADNPRNPIDRTEDLDDLANVAEYGILQPILVTTRENFLKDNPSLASTVGEAPYVILAGHRRKAAALSHGLDEVPVHIRHDLSAHGGDAIVRLLENLSRKALDPISEALDYQRLYEENELPIREIARRLHIKSHAVVSKRLKLLTLPTSLQEAIAGGQLGVTDAEALARLDSGELQVRAWDLMKSRDSPVAEAIAEVQRRPNHRSPAEARLKRSAGDHLAASDSTDQDDHGSTAEAAAKSDEARFAACANLAGQRPDPDDAVQLIASYALQGTSSTSHRKAVRIAHRWLREAGVGPVDAGDPLNYLAQVGREDLLHVAFMVAVAADEIRIRDHRRSWHQRDAAHLRRLQAVGYMLSDWERQRLTRLIDG
jgi:ParB/RepB/Spo0J family partition protein